jgi:hypothetical protein
MRQTHGFHSRLSGNDSQRWEVARLIALIAHISRKGRYNERTNDSLSVGSLTDRYRTGGPTDTHREGLIQWEALFEPILSECMNLWSMHEALVRRYMNEAPFSAAISSCRCS